MLAFPQPLMKKLATAALSAVLASQMFITRTFALVDNSGGITGLSQQTDLQAVIVNVVGRVLDFILLIAVVFVIIAGIRLIVSSGDEGEKDKAKKTIIYVIVGIIVILLARVIVLFVNTQLTA